MKEQRFLRRQENKDRNKQTNKRRSFKFFSLKLVCFGLHFALHHHRAAASLQKVRNKNDRNKNVRNKSGRNKKFRNNNNRFFVVFI
jgi:hypothetical protein